MLEQGEDLITMQVGYVWEKSNTSTQNTSIRRLNPEFKVRKSFPFSFHLGKCEGAYNKLEEMKTWRREISLQVIDKGQDGLQFIDEPH